MNPLERCPQVAKHHTKMLFRSLLPFMTLQELTTRTIEEEIVEIQDLPS
jgi:hypothetical protein